MRNETHSQERIRDPAFLRKDELNRADSTSPPQRNIDSLMGLEAKARLERSAAQRFADTITAAAGSAPSILIHIIWLGGWLLIDFRRLDQINPANPFPFSFFTVVVSLEAIFLTLLVLMSQNRIMKESDKRALLDLQISLLAEQEATMTLRMVRRICEHLGIDNESSAEADHLQQATDIHVIARALDKEMPE